MIAIRKTTFDGLSNRNRRLFRWVTDRLDLGDPATLQAPGGAQWYVFDDPRITLEEVCVLGCLAANLADIQQNYDPDGRTRQEIKQDIRTALAAKLKLPDEITFTANGDMWSEALAANSAPAAIRAGQIPETWRPAAA